MKKMKKIFAVLLTFIMAMGLSVTAFAADTYTITGPINGHIYEVYQIFTGDLADGILSNVKWGENGTGEKGEKVDSDTLKEIEELDVNALDSVKLSTITKYVNLQTNPVATLNDETASVSVVAGYYLIKDKDDSVTGNDTYTTYIVEIVENITIDPKSEKPTSEKKVKDTNDSTDVTSDWQDSADYDIGDRVPFKLTATVAADYAEYEKYYLAFHDKEEIGLTFDGTVTVKVDNVVITEGYELVTESLDDECTFEVVFENLKTVTSVKAGSVITVEYTSTLNENAKIGSEGNPNKMHIEYSNNPNDEQGGETGKTPDDTVIVFTYKVVVDKVDENQKALVGAQFTLEKFVVDTNGEDKYDDVKGTWTPMNVVETNPESTFTFKGLDDGIYRLTETETPAGYNTIDPIYFTVTADHDITSDNPQLNSLNGEVTSGKITFTATEDDGSLSTDVVNKQGATLPETGGMGTTIFYVLGTVLVLGAAILLITKKRMNAE